MPNPWVLISRLLKLVEYHWLKLLHILSAVVMTGTGIGLAYFLFLAVLTKKQEALVAIARWVIWGDWLFTLPAIITQIISGLLLVERLGWSFASVGMHWILTLYTLMLVCWLPVIVIQYKLYYMSLEMGREAQDVQYHRQFKWLFCLWVLLGSIAVGCVMLLFWVMIFKPFSFFSA